MLTDLQVDTLIARLRADLRFHQDESARITRENLDVDAEEHYSIEADTEESFHTGRVEALANVIDILCGQDVVLYSESFSEHIHDTRKDDFERPYLVTE